MVAIARGEENTPGRINWFITVSGVLTDAFNVGFQIWDVTGGYPGTQLFPAVPGTWEDVTSAPGRFSPGSYYAYDNGNAQGWTPSLGEPLGTHLIKWQWKISASAPYQQGQEEFEVLVQSAGSSEETYVTVQDIRDLGVPDETATPPGPTDDAVLATIKLCQALFDRATKQWFVPRTLQFAFDGSNSDAAHFGVPIIDIEWLKLNHASDALAATYYRVYDGRSYPDDRKNPRIKLIGSDDDQSIYTAPVTYGRLRFRKGRQNQEVRGTFGYVEDDGTVPLPVQEALKRMVIERLGNPAYVAPGTVPIAVPGLSVGAVVEEVTDGHKLKFSAPGYTDRRAGLSGISADPFVHDVIRLYKAPIGIATPAHWSYS